MEKIQKNNIAAIRNTAIELLEIPIKNENIGEFGFVFHPFFNNTFVVYKEELVDIFKEKDKFNEYVKALKEHIMSEPDVYRLMLLVNRPYRILFLSLINNYLNEESFANLLKDCYTETEFPNRDVNVSVKKIKDMFEKANKDFLMEESEKDFLKNLDDEITIYRGFFSNEYYKALSWTLDFEKAKFFATRFSDEGSIYQANIKKENIYAYFDCRNEKEVIVDYNKLYNITKKEQFN